MASFLAYVSVTYNDSTVTLELNKVYKVPEAHMGYYQCLMSLLYLPAAFLIPRIFKNVSFKTIITVSLFLITLACLIKGPSKLFHLPKK